jgi:hypothetical protein
MDKPNEILSGFRDQCARLQMDYDLFCTLFMSGQKQLDLFQQVAPMFFRDLDRLLRDSQFIQFCCITDPPGLGSRTNLSTNYLLQEISWPPGVKKKLDAVNTRLMRFRPHIEPARSKRLTHVEYARGARSSHAWQISERSGSAIFEKPRRVLENCARVCRCRIGIAVHRRSSRRARADASASSVADIRYMRELHADGTSNRGPRLRKENGLGAAGGRYDLWAG